jgi:glycosyltransferase involved in cell wall biosynthesis
VAEQHSALKPQNPALVPSDHGCRTLLSIVMYYIKPAPFLNEALSSIVTQRTDEVELIVVAGHAAGEDLGIAPHLMASIDNLIVETDDGPWDAANKGWRAAQGQWIQFCMSDDWLPEGSLERTLQVLRSDPKGGVLSGGMTFVTSDANGNLRTIRSVGAQDLVLDRILDDVATPAVIVRRTVLEELGGFDRRFAQAHDRELLLRAWRRKIPHQQLAHETYRMRVHGLSRTTSGNPMVKLAYWRDHVSFADALLLTGELLDEQQAKLQRWRDEELIKFRIVQCVTAAYGAPLSVRLPIHRGIAALIRIGCRKLARRRSS